MPDTPFTSYAEAETRAKAGIASGIWINAFACRGQDGRICVRVQRKMSPTHQDYGAWVEINDNNVD